MARRFLLGLCLLVAACGGGGGSPALPGSGTGGLHIETTALLPGNVGHAYYQRLDCTGGTAPYSFWVSTSGDPLPEGLSVTGTGEIVGTPSQSSVASVIFVAQDHAGTVTLASLPMEVRDVEISPKAGGALVPGASLQFSASGGVASYRFEMAFNQSGGALSSQGAYTAGSTAGVDVVRVTDRDGFFDEVGVTVGTDPFVGFRPVWGATDVWYVDWDVVYSPTPVYATDLDAALVSLGLRDPASTGALGTEADQLARYLVIRRALGHLSAYYGNNFDGSPKPGGLEISFVGPSGPGSGSTSPAPGGVTLPGGKNYNTICVRYGDSGSVIGTAWLDTGNGAIEHDCGNPGGQSLGIFANRIVGPYLVAFANGLSFDPVDAGDVDRLRTLLLGGVPADARAQAIFNVSDGYGRILATVLAHEIGHSLGLQHSSPSDGPPDIMNAAITISPSILYHFNAMHWATLVGNLPGPSR